jgi:hypothetical protein
MLWCRFCFTFLLLPVLAAQTGIITTIAGTTPSFDGDGGLAASAALALANLTNK